MIYVCALSAVDDNVARLKPSHLLSVLGPQAMIPTPEGIDPTRHHRMGVNDIAEPQDGYVAAGADHVAALIDFLRGWDGAAPLLIHCWAGISRSTAAALVALCLDHPGREHEAAMLLRFHAPHANPNRRIIALADAALEREGRLIAAVAAMGPAQFRPEGPTVRLPRHLDDWDMA